MKEWKKGQEGFSHEAKTFKDEMKKTEVKIKPRKRKNKLGIRRPRR